MKTANDLFCFVFVVTWPVCSWFKWSIYSISVLNMWCVSLFQSHQFDMLYLYIYICWYVVYDILLGCELSRVYILLNNCCPPRENCRKSILNCFQEAIIYPCKSMALNPVCTLAGDCYGCQADGNCRRFQVLMAMVAVFMAMVCRHDQLWYNMAFHYEYMNILHAEFLWGSTTVDLHFLSFCNNLVAQAVENLPPWWQSPIYHTELIPIYTDNMEVCEENRCLVKSSVIMVWVQALPQVDKYLVMLCGTYCTLCGWIIWKGTWLYWSRWHHQMEPFSTLLAICVGNSPVTGEGHYFFPVQRPMMRSFDVFFDLSLNNQLNKQSGGWWFEMPSCPLWCHCNVIVGNILWRMVYDMRMEILQPTFAGGLSNLLVYMHSYKKYWWNAYISKIIKLTATFPWG